MNEQTEKNQTENQVDKVKSTTLGALGLTLPIGQKGAKDLSFSFKDWDMEVEEKLADLQERSKNVGAFVRQMMDMLLESFCGQDWDSIPDNEKVMAMHNLHFPNMMYMYIALRVEELGNELAFDHITCPNCKRGIQNYVADMSTLEIKCKETGDEGENLEKRYELKKPILVGEKPITALKISVTQWGALEKVPAEKAGNGAAVKTAIFESSIAGAYNNDEPIEGFVDVKAVVKKLKKFDIEKLQKEITENNCGPEMLVGGECPHCKAEFVKALDWGYETFFDSSSL